MEITYKEFFEKSKKIPELQQLVTQSFTASIETSLLAQKVFPYKPQVDSGKLMLNALSTVAKMIDIILTDRNEITAEYIADLLNSY